MLDIGRGYDGWVGWGEGMVPEIRQEHVPYLYSLSYLATQCINNMNRVTKCRFILRISKPLIPKYIHVCHPDN